MPKCDFNKVALQHLWLAASVKDNLIKYKCLSCNKDYSNKLDEELKKKFKNKVKFSTNDINKCNLLLR